MLSAASNTRRHSWDGRAGRICRPVLLTSGAHLAPQGGDSDEESYQRYQREWLQAIDACHENNWNREVFVDYYNWSLDGQLRIDCNSVAIVLANEAWRKAKDKDGQRATR